MIENRTKKSHFAKEQIELRNLPMTDPSKRGKNVVGTPAILKINVARFARNVVKQETFRGIFTQCEIAFCSRPIIVLLGFSSGARKTRREEKDGDI